ncbi:single-stranded DNA-binding protein [Candidatus Peregrinibacteria bacterium CG11_big_fil_rev_8_21_14_0_20_46_8]|nr:MAG: single-stranded DNA-binding protein [Candidatus Peregrinibacteria bacterium CG11_big_fil_rev_8_21_14_0_20_46_8]
MRSVNKVILIGNLTRDPEMRETSSGQKIATFGLATNRDWMTKDGRKQQSAEFHELVAWAKLGEICHTYLKKGKLIYVEGYLKTRVQDLPDGTKKFRTEIVVQDMIMLDKRGERADEEIPGAPTKSSHDLDLDEEIPGIASAPRSSEQSGEEEDLFEG